MQPSDHKVSKQDKYLHNSSGYSKFKHSTEKRKKNVDNSKIGSQYWGRKNADNYHALSPTLYPLPLRMRSETSDITPVPEMDISFLIYSRKEIKTIKTERKIKKKKKKKKKK